MDHQFCPGAKFVRQPKPEFMECPGCHEEVEIWSDEIRAVCPKCGKSLMPAESAPRRRPSRRQQ